jgi:hypothetical protein
MKPLHAKLVTVTNLSVNIEKAQRRVNRNLHIRDLWGAPTARQRWACRNKSTGAAVGTACAFFYWTARVSNAYIRIFIKKSVWEL